MVETPSTQTNIEQKVVPAMSKSERKFDNLISKLRTMEAYKEKLNKTLVTKINFVRQRKNLMMTSGDEADNKTNIALQKISFKIDELQYQLDHLRDNIDEIVPLDLSWLDILKLVKADEMNFNSENQGQNYLEMMFAKSLDNRTWEVDFHHTESYEQGIGAAEIWGKRYEALAIATAGGQFVTGTLQVRNNRLGYYDTRGNYLKIYSGYRVRLLSDQEMVTAMNNKSPVNVGKYYINQLTESVKMQVVVDNMIGSTDKSETWQKLQDMTGADVWSMRKNLGARGMKKFVDNLRINYDSQAVIDAANIANKIYKLPPNTMYRIAQIESGMGKNLASSTGALGAFQLTKYYYLGVGTENDINPFNLQQAANRAASRLQDMISRIGLNDAVRAYNQGEKNRNSSDGYQYLKKFNDVQV